MVSKRSTPSRKPLIVTLTVMVLILSIFWFRALRAPKVKRPPKPPTPPGQVDEKPHPEESMVLSPSLRAVPGVAPVRILRYRNTGASRVALSGSWDGWAKQHPMKREGGLWRINVKGFDLTRGRYDFKFINDGEWEKGENRHFFANPEGLIEQPAGLIISALQETDTRVDVFLDRNIPEDARIRFDPEVEIARIEQVESSKVRGRLGYSVAGNLVTFVFDEKFYRVSLSQSDRVTVAGEFNGWRSNGVGGQFELRDDDGDDFWEVRATLNGMRSEPHLKFKFVVNETEWLDPPLRSPNAVPDGKGNTNLELDPKLSASPIIKIHTVTPLRVDRAYQLIIDGVTDRQAFRQVSPGSFLDTFKSGKPLGAITDKARGVTTYRVFSPRANTVEILFYDQAEYAGDPKPRPSDIVGMARDRDGTWSVELPGVHVGRYYVFRIDGPSGHGEGFNGRARVPDPYASAMAHSHNCSIVIDREATNRWFSGWTDQEFKTPALEDLIIYETHVRDFSSHASSGVPKDIRGKYDGIVASLGTGTGLDHLKWLGVNAIELMPICEFENGSDRYDWGYGPVCYFSPEASYASDPLRGSQYYEFKQLVNDLHELGYAVILDVVYNHVAGPNIFQMQDRKYFFRMDADHIFSNFSGCGNDVKSEAPMMRRLIVENVLYWMKEFHIDGFRFDLAELIDMETLMEVRDRARALNPSVILISEPWSFRGDHRAKLRGTGWSAWNGDYRHVLKRFVLGEGNREDVKRMVRGSVDNWAAEPRQAINYLESHDDKTFADEITSHPSGDGRNLRPLDIARNRLAAAALFTSLGVPMLCEGQEWIRSKHGIHNTYNKGDKVNALRWEDRRRKRAFATLKYYRGLAKIRLSAGGQSLRWADPVPKDYIRWILPADPKTMGYMINMERKYPGMRFVVLLNANTETRPFDIRFPPGRWRLISDGLTVDSNGVVGVNLPPSEDGVRHIEVTGLTGYIFAGL